MTVICFFPIVFDKDGNYLDNTIIGTTSDSERILMAEFDLDKIRAYRKFETWGKAYRKPQVYTDLLSNEVNGPFVCTK